MGRLRALAVTAAIFGAPAASAQTAPAGLANAPVPAPEPTAPEAPPVRWCAEEFETLPGDVCYFEPSGGEPVTKLAIFLHGLVKVGSDWQYNQQRSAARVAKQNGFAVLMPRGRVGAGSQKFADQWNWPTSLAGQQRYEREVLDEWRAARATVEARRGVPFERLYVLGFSAGAYYAASLATGNRFHADGFGVFAGGGAGKDAARHLSKVRPRAPIYVGWGMKDSARHDPEQLARALKAAGWPHRAAGRRGVGHAMTDSQVREAISFFERKSAARNGKSSPRKL